MMKINRLLWLICAPFIHDPTNYIKVLQNNSLFFPYKISHTVLRLHPVILFNPNDPFHSMSVHINNSAEHPITFIEFCQSNTMITLLKIS